MVIFLHIVEQVYREKVMSVTNKQIQEIILELCSLESKQDLDPTKSIQLLKPSKEDQFILDLPRNQQDHQTNPTSTSTQPLGFYIPMLTNNQPTIILYKDNIKNFIINQLSDPTKSSIEIWKLVVTTLNVVYTVYNHERFHFYLDLKRKLSPVQPYSLVEEAFANAFAYLSVKSKGYPLSRGNNIKILFDPKPTLLDNLLNRNRDIDRRMLRKYGDDMLNKVFSTFSLPGYKDWILYKDNFFSHLKDWLDLDILSDLETNNKISIEEYLMFDLSSAYKQDIKVEIK